MREHDVHAVPDILAHTEGVTAERFEGIQNGFDVRWKIETVSGGSSVPRTRALVTSTGYLARGTLEHSIRV